MGSTYSGRSGLLGLAWGRGRFAGWENVLVLVVLTCSVQLRGDEMKGRSATLSLASHRFAGSEPLVLAHKARKMQERVRYPSCVFQWPQPTMFVEKD